MLDNDKNIINDILKYCDNINETLSKIEFEKSKFLEDKIIQDAIAFKFF